MNFIQWPVACAFALATVSTAHAENLRIRPATPAAGQTFTIDVDYRTACEGALGTVVASLHPSDVAVTGSHIALRFNIDCYAPVASHTLHISAVLDGVPAGTYPIYAEGSMNTGYIPIGLLQLEGAVNVGAASSVLAVPTLSFLASCLMTVALAMVAVGVRRRLANGSGSWPTRRHRG